MTFCHDFEGNMNLKLFLDIPTCMLRHTFCELYKTRATKVYNVVIEKEGIEV